MNIKYFGLNVEQELLDNPLPVKAVQNFAADNSDADVKVYIGERFGDEPLEWFINVASSTGRRSVILTQRVKGGSVLISNRIATV